MRSRCAAGIFHRSAVFSSRICFLVHLTIRPPESDSHSESYRSSGRETEKYRKPLDSISYGSGITAATLRNAYGVDGALHACRYILLAEEAAIGAVEFRRTAESAAVALERWRHMNFICRVSLEHLILGDQTFGAFGKEHLVAELNGRAHLAALDQVGRGLEA